MNETEHRICWPNPQRVVDILTVACLVTALVGTLYSCHTAAPVTAQPVHNPTVFYATIPDIAKAFPPRREDKQQDVILRVEAADYDKVVELARVRGMRLKVGVE